MQDRITEANRLFQALSKTQQTEIIRQMLIFLQKHQQEQEK